MHLLTNGYKKVTPLQTPLTMMLSAAGQRHGMYARH
jgi:hypothetical protein